MAFSVEADVIQDGTHLSASTLRQDASELCALLKNADTGRVATDSPRADVVACALSACAAAGRELLLLRDRVSEDAEWNEKWGVSFVIDQDLALHTVGPASNNGPPGVVLTTSGTTGTPKMTQHTLAGLLGRIKTVSREVEARWLLTYHPASFAGMQVLLTSMVNPGATLLATSNPTASSLAQYLLAHQPTHISGTPTLWRALILALGGRAESLELKHVTLGGEAVDEPTLRLLRSTFPTAGIAQIYASTEAGALFSVRDGLAGFPATWLETGVDGVKLKIRDGILHVKSPRAMKKYIGRTPADQPLDEDGWLVTGDEVRIEGDRVRFIGRADATINVGGMKVRPEAIESVLLRLDGVEDVFVYGIPNPITGAIVAADVVASVGTETVSQKSIAEFAREHLESHQIPRRIRLVDSIEFTDTGKKKRTSP